MNRITKFSAYVAPRLAKKGGHGAPPSLPSKGFPHYDRQPKGRKMLRVKTWALAHDGFVVEMRTVALADVCPFAPAPEGSRVLDVTGAECEIGFLVDDKGNVARAEAGRTGPLLPGQAANHDRGAVPAAPTAVLMARLATAEPHPLDQSTRSGKMDHSTTKSAPFEHSTSFNNEKSA